MTSGRTLINGRPLRYRVRRHPRARRRAVRVSREAGVVVTLLRSDRLTMAQEMLQDCSAWVAEKAEKAGVWDGPVVRSFTTGSRILLHGQPRTLEFTLLPAGRRRSRMLEEGSILRLELTPQELLSPREPLIRLLKAEGGRFLRRRVAHWESITDLHPTKVVVGERRTRWGSCSSRGTLSLCYRLVMAPTEVADVIVVHELCHLRHMDHSDRFYALLESFLPDYRETEDWLRVHYTDMMI